METNEALVGLILTVFTAISGVAVKYLRDFLARKAVDNALWAAAGLVIARLGQDLQGAAPSARDVALTTAAQYVKDKVPDSLKSQGVNTNDLGQMVLSRVGQLVAGKAG